MFVVFVLFVVYVVRAYFAKGGLRVLRTSMALFDNCAVGKDLMTPQFDWPATVFDFVVLLRLAMLSLALVAARC